MTEIELSKPYFDKETNRWKVDVESSHYALCINRNDPSLALTFCQSTPWDECFIVVHAKGEYIVEYRDVIGYIALKDFKP